LHSAMTPATVSRFKSYSGINVLEHNPLNESKILTDFDASSEDLSFSKPRVSNN